MFGILKKIFGGKASPKYDVDAYKRALEKLASEDLRTLTTNHKCIALRLMIKAIFLAAEDRDLYIANVYTGAITIDEVKFPTEIAIIEELMESMALSDAMRDWVNAATQDLAKTLSLAFPEDTTGQAWPHLEREKQEELVNAVLNMQAQILRNALDADLDLKPPKICFEESPLTGLIGFLKTTPVDEETFHIMDISVNENLLDGNHYGAIITCAVHEGLHSIMTQLARLYFEGKIQNDHPFAGDAEILFEKRINKAHGPPAIPTAYRLDPEERLVTSAHVIFDIAYNGRPTIPSPHADQDSTPVTSANKPTPR